MDAAEQAVEWVLKQLASLAAWLWELVWPIERTRPARKPTPSRARALDRHLVGRRRLLCVSMLSSALLTPIKALYMQWLRMRLQGRV